MRSMIGGFSFDIDVGVGAIAGATIRETCCAVLLPGRNRDPLGRPGEVPFIPLRPIWPGFAINTLFYAAILWGLFAAPLALRRRRRIKRGLCPKCAYPIGASDVCTECGTGWRISP